MEKKKRLIFLCSIVLVTLLLMAGQDFAQIRTGVIRGTVKDETGVELPGVAVEIRGEALMGSRATTTDNKGEFRFLTLPIGKNYEVVFSLSGFQTVTQKNLQVTIGGTIVLDIVMKPATLAEEVTVVGQAPLVDVAKSSFSSTFDSKFIESIPTSRFSFFDMLSISPGLTSGTNKPNAFGSDRSGNSFYVQGIDMSAPSTGCAWNWPMPDILAEVEVTGIGAPAEYGNFQGGVFNVVAKTGSNTFHGAVKYFFKDQKLTANNTPDQKWPYHIGHWHDFILEFSGPIMKDKLWFYGAFQHKTEQTSGVGSNPALAGKGGFWPSGAIKIDFQINKKNKLSMFTHYENWKQSTAPSETVPFEALISQRAPSIAPTLDWLCMLSDKTYFEIKYGGFYAYLKYEPDSGDMMTPGHKDWGTGYSSVNATWYQHWWTNRTGFSGSLTHFADDFIKGNHEFKFGVQYNHGYSKSIEGYIGGVAYYDSFGKPYEAYFRVPGHKGGVVDQLGFFAQDNWQVNDRLNLNLGLRFDYNQGKIPDWPQLDAYEKPTGTIIPGIPKVADWKNLSPRIGMVYQLTADRKTVLRASYGRYCDELIIGSIQDATPSQSILYVYKYNSNTGKYSDLLRTVNPTSNIGLDSNLKTPSTDQYSLALERELFQDFSLSATFLYKKSKRLIARQNTTAQYTEKQFYDAYGDQYFTVYSQIKPINNFYMVTNPGDEVSYRGLLLVVNKRFSHNFQLYSSLTLSRANEKIKGYVDKNVLINRDGVASYDRLWMWKTSGTYNFPYDIVTAISVIYQQGGMWQRTVRTSLNQGSVTFFAEPRNSRHFPNQLYFDVKIEKDFRIYNRMTANFSADIFNILNRNTHTNVVATRADASTFMVPRSFFNPRLAMVGLRLTF